MNDKTKAVQSMSDGRFNKNIDRHGVGTAEFMNCVIKAYCKK